MHKLPVSLVCFWQLLELRSLWSDSAYTAESVDVYLDKCLRQNSQAVDKKTQLEVAENN